MYCFIVNKTSGNGRAIKIWSQIEKILLEQQLNYSVHFTQKSKHATQIVQEMINRKETEVIIAVGGDGTVHEVINGLAGSTIPLGVIPCGSGNDYCRELGIPLRWDRALQRILNDKPKTIDIGLINGEYFATVVGVGFDGQVAQTTNKSKYKRILNYVRMGGISYIIGVLKVLFYYKPTNVRLKVDHHQLTIPDVWLIAVANSPCYAGGMLICPDAKSNDGFFDICVVQGMSKWGLLRLFPTVFKGKHIFHPSIQILKGKEIEVLSDTPMIAHGDGEFVGETPLKIMIHPRTLYVL